MCVSCGGFGIHFLMIWFEFRLDFFVFEVFVVVIFVVEIFVVEIFVFEVFVVEIFVVDLFVVVCIEFADFALVVFQDGYN